MDVVSNSFNDFFVNVGPELADKIPDGGTSEKKQENLITLNPFSMFLTAVDEREVVDIVTKCKNKKSTDCDDIDMTVLKKVIDVISKPFTYVTFHSKLVHFLTK